MQAENGGSIQSGQPAGEMGGSTMLRSVAAVAAGFALLAIGAMVAARIADNLAPASPEAGPAPGNLALNLALSALFAVAAGYVTAKAAPHAPQRHVLALAGALLLLSVAGVVAIALAGTTQGDQLAWYPYAKLVLGPAGAGVGGWLRIASTRSGRRGSRTR